MALTKDQIIEAIEQMSLLDIVDLYKTMQDKWGVTPMAAAAPAAAAAPPPRRRGGREDHLRRDPHRL